jgi:formate dehydrogenase major subunit
MPKGQYDRDFGRYLFHNTGSAGTWSGFPRYAVSLLRAWFGDAARADNGWAFHYLPHITGNHSHMVTVADMADRKPLARYQELRTTVRPPAGAGSTAAATRTG